MRMVLAGTSPDGQLFYVIDPVNPKLDGVLIRVGEVRYVPFFSTLSRGDFKPVKGAEFLKRLWSTPEYSQQKDWNDQFYLHKVPFSEEDLDSVEFMLVNVPDEREPAPDRQPL